MSGFLSMKELLELLDPKWLELKKVNQNILLAGSGKYFEPKTGVLYSPL